MPEIYENRQAKVKEIVEDMLRERKQQKNVCFYNSRIRELCLLAYWLKLRCGQWQSHVVKSYSTIIMMVLLLLFVWIIIIIHVIIKIIITVIVVIL